jgi:hypothetical protein
MFVVDISSIIGDNLDGKARVELQRGEGGFTMEQSPLLRALKEYFEREALLQKKPPSLDLEAQENQDAARS